MFNPDAIKRDFPIFNQKDNQSLVYLDNASTTHKPQSVIDKIVHFYSHENANVHRANHAFATEATQGYEQARQTVADFIGAQDKSEIIWTKGTTEAINLAARCFIEPMLKNGDEILISALEHHANIVPWQQIAERTGAKILALDLDIEQSSTGDIRCELLLAELDKKLSPRTRLLAITHVSNVTGARMALETIIKKAHNMGCLVLVDGAQGISHERVNVTELDADFYAFSAHKLFGPTGIGALYAKAKLTETAKAWLGGGKMVKKVTLTKTDFANAPYKFEAGTPPIAGVLGMAAAIRWYQSLDHQAIFAHKVMLQNYCYQSLQAINEIRLIGYQPHSSIISFLVDGIHHQDIAFLLAEQHIAIRTGMHCAEPLMTELGITGCLRVSFALYNSKEDVECFISALKKALEIL